MVKALGSRTPGLGPHSLLSSTKISSVSVESNAPPFIRFGMATLKVSSRRNFSEYTMELWFELEDIAKSTILSINCDSLIWQCESSRQFSSSYDIINFRGVTSIYLPIAWKLSIPTRIHVFLWLISHNKIMTRDNLKKRKLRKHEDCVFSLL